MSSFLGVPREGRHCGGRRPMAHVNLSVPGELLERVRAELPGLNLSEVLRDALHARVESCTHDELGCARCGREFDRRGLIDLALAQFYGEALWRINELATQVGTAEGAARVLRQVAQSFGVSNAASLPLARPTRRAREAALDAKVRDMRPAQRRRMHAAR